MITREAFTSPVKLQVNNTGINTISVNDASFSISNPATNQLTIQVKNIHNKIQFEVFDVAGNKITQSQSSGSHLLTIDLSNLAGGLYFIKAKTSGSEHTQKFILKHE